MTLNVREVITGSNLGPQPEVKVEKNGKERKGLLFSPLINILSKVLTTGYVVVM